MKEIRVSLSAHTLCHLQRKSSSTDTGPAASVEEGLPGASVGRKALGWGPKPICFSSLAWKDQHSG